MTHKHDAIRATHPNVVTMRGDEAFDLNDNPVQYDMEVAQTYIDAHAYKEQRAQAYPSIADQLDMLYHGGLKAWKSAIDEIKDKYPKP